MSKKSIVKTVCLGGMAVFTVFAVTTVKTFVRTAKQAGMFMKAVRN